MFDRYIRWRHSRGFGIHSPSAYRLIREVLCPSSRYGYYSYASLEGYVNRDWLLRDLRLLCRLLVDFHPDKVYAGRESRLVPLVKELLPAAEITRDAQSADFALIDSAPLPSSSTGITTIFIHGNPSGVLPALTAGMTGGHVFVSLRNALVVNRSTLPFQTFRLNF